MKPSTRSLSPVVTWGVFDGVHRGHRHVIRKTVRWARSVRAPSLVVTFDPHPVEVLTGRPVTLLCSLERRLAMIASLGVDRIHVIRFTRSFAKTSAEDFVRKFIMGKLHAHRIVLGHDNMFGKDRKGNLRMLRVLERKGNLRIIPCRAVRTRGRIVSSSVIRALIGKGDLRRACEFLGYPPTLSGKVTRGAGRGIRLGFPTANLAVEAGVVPPRGVYATRARVGTREYGGVTNIGVRPTFLPESKRTVVETHLLGYRGGPLARKGMDLEFLEKIRDERKFSGVEELRKQIQKDIDRCRR